MKLAVRFAVTILTILLTTSGNMQAGQAADFDHSKFDQILKTYVDPEGRVDYNGIAADNTFSDQTKCDTMVFVWTTVPNIWSMEVLAFTR